MERVLEVFGTCWKSLEVCGTWKLLGIVAARGTCPSLGCIHRFFSSPNHTCAHLVRSNSHLVSPPTRHVSESLLFVDLTGGVACRIVFCAASKVYRRKGKQEFPSAVQTTKLDTKSFFELMNSVVMMRNLAKLFNHCKWGAKNSPLFALPKDCQRQYHWNRLSP